MNLPNLYIHPAIRIYFNIDFNVNINFMTILSFVHLRRRYGGGCPIGLTCVPLGDWSSSPSVEDINLIGFFLFLLSEVC